MQSRLRLADEVLHPLLLMFPLGLFALAFVFDVAGPLGAPQLIGTLGQCTIVAGLAGGMPAISAAWFDAVSAPRGTAARTRVLGVLLDLGVLVLYAVIALVRLQHSGRTAPPGLIGLEALGLTAAVFSAWLAGRLGGPRRPKPIRSG
jgi:uncharacterized membrane protein